MVDGFKIIANSVPDLANTEEVDVKTYGNGAEVKEAGAMINMVTKSGGNDFHGRYSEAYMRQPSQQHLAGARSARPESRHLAAVLQRRQRRPRRPHRPRQGCGSTGRTAIAATRRRGPAWC